MRIERDNLTREARTPHALRAFRPAQALYRRVGFRYCGPFSGYGPDPNSVFMFLEP